MMYTLSFIAGMIAIFLIARYNRSNKLFWILLTAMLTGFAGVSIFTHVTNGDEKKISVDQTNLMQLPTASTAMFADNYLPAETLVETSTNSASPVVSEYGSSEIFGPLTPIFESDIGYREPYNTS